MQDTDILFPEDIYAQHLATINGIKFTRREIDVISCLLNARGTSKIASLLSIASRTVVTHIRNIMLKLECSSREHIIDFIEKSSKLPLLRNYYSSLVNEAAFTKSLKEIAKLKREENLKPLIIYGTSPTLKNALLHRLSSDFSHVNIVGEVVEKDFNQKMEEAKFRVLLLEKEDDKDAQASKDFDSLDLSGQEDYCLCVLEILKNLIPHPHFERIVENFRKHYNALSAPSSYQNIEEVRNRSGKISVRSDLIIPADSALLLRQELMAQIKEALNGQGNIQTIALVGMGGAGKTIMARLYAREQKYPIVWEMNAETHESLIYSFETLAYALSHTEEEKKALRGIQEMSHAPDRESKIILWVRDKLKQNPNWFLIYDNVVRFTYIQKYFPYDSETWGVGKIIITSRDSNIKHNSHINSTLSLGELELNDRLNLFNNILINPNAPRIIDSQIDRATSFLNQIPPFPLDVSIAAYYLKTTQIPFESYINHLNLSSKDLAVIQQDILRETTQYTKTRHSIIKLSVDCLLKAHPDFKALLLFICLLDSKDIPQDLLNAYKNEIVVENFIHHLRKYSLTICQQYNDLHLSPPLSIHRSIQEISLVYLKEILNLDKEHDLLQLVVDTLETYITQILDREDLSQMMLLLSHGEKLLSHQNLLTNGMRSTICNRLGSMYFCLCYYTKAKQFFEESLTLLSQQNTMDPLTIAHGQLALGMTYREMDDFRQARNLIEKSIEIYKRNSFENNVKFARALTHLGNVHRSIGNYQEALHLLEQGIIAYKEHLPQNYTESFRATGNLGIAYKCIGDYEKAKDLLEQTATVYKKYLHADHVQTGWILLHLGTVYKELGNEVKANTLLGESLEIYEKHFSICSTEAIWSLAHLANVYKELGNYKDAKKRYEESLILYERHYGNEHIKTAWVLRDLGQIHLLENNPEAAEGLLEKALKIFQKNKHPESYTCLEHLAEVYLNQMEGQKNKSGLLKKQAIDYLKRAEHIIKVSFFENSSHILRIQNKRLSLE